MSVLTGDLREPPSFAYDSGHSSQTGPQGDRAVEALRLRVFDNWAWFGVSYVGKAEEGTVETWSHSQAYGSRLSANMEND